jgi:hypothetical protein
MSLTPFQALALLLCSAAAGFAGTCALASELLWSLPA